MNYLLSIFLCIMLMMPEKSEAKGRIINIYWNTTNPMFRIDNTDNVIDINKGNAPWEYDQANIICPSYPEHTRPADVESYIVYSVNKAEYDNCHIRNPNPRVVAVCNNPNRLSLVTITFRSFTPTPGGLEFKPGQTYYFISTSSRSDLYRRIGGRCSTHNMKVMFNVARSSSSEDSPSSGSASRRPSSNTKVNVPRSHVRGFPGQDEGFPSLYEDLEELESNSVEHNKRSEDYGNQLVKQASVVQHNSSAFAIHKTNAFAVVTVLVLPLLLPHWTCWS